MCRIVGKHCWCSEDRAISEAQFNQGGLRGKLNLISSEVSETDYHFKGEGPETRITEHEAWNVRICEDTEEAIKAAEESLEEDGENEYQDKVERAVSGNSGMAMVSDVDGVQGNGMKDKEDEGRKQKPE